MSWFLLGLAIVLGICRYRGGHPSWVVVILVSLAGIFFDYVLWLSFGAVAYYLLSRPTRTDYELFDKISKR